MLTDSGGIQEEAPALNVPALVMRETTERPEGLASGGVALVGTGYDAIVSAVRGRLREPRIQRSLPGPCSYGDGKAAERIVSITLGRSGVNVGAPIALQTI
ncbi:MAG: UDP-N-acetyl glucosamine 2-epimerase [Acidobacteriota bacterium]|nr:UDP-N-acetyl glucosamine 2-epimerase [Acidobacteriota bacterium]